jgi:hypothetical protein
MANPTNPFSWQMPTASDLVTDLPADFEVFGQAVATSLQDLLGGTTGQVLAKATNADMDFTWVAQDDSNAIQNAIVDAKGDLIAATAADTPARLAVGTNGQVLTASSGAATGLAWATIPASAMTLIRRSSFTNVADTGTTFDGVFTSTYKTYVIVVERLFSVSAGGDDAQFVLRYAGPTTQTSLYYGMNYTCAFNASSFGFASQNNASAFSFANFIGESNDVMAATITMNGVGNSSERPRFYGLGTQGTSNFGTTNFAGWQNDARTYTGIAFKSSSTNITGDVAIYGLAI